MRTGMFIIESKESAAYMMETISSIPTAILAYMVYAYMYIGNVYGVRLKY